MLYLHKLFFYQTINLMSEKLGIPYMGSKRKLSSIILQKITQRHHGISDFYDLFGFLISWFWVTNVKKANIATKKGQLIYALGAMIGGLSGLILTKIIL